MFLSLPSSLSLKIINQYNLKTFSKTSLHSVEMECSLHSELNVNVYIYIAPPQKYVNSPGLCPNIDPEDLDWLDALWNIILVIYQHPHANQE